MVGTVTISLQDFELLKSQADGGKKVREGILQAAKELEVFLSFLCSREHMQEHIDEFNSYSKTCKILIVDGRAKIQIKEDEHTDNQEDQHQDEHDS